MNFDEWWSATERVPYWAGVEKRQARDIWRAALEEAASLCVTIDDLWGEQGGPTIEAAERIRALIEAP